MRAFIAIDVPFTPRMREFRENIEGKVKFVEEKNLHLTLKFLGEIDASLIEKIHEIIKGCRREPFTLRFRGVGFFPNERYIRVIWIGVENADPLIAISRCIDAGLTELGFKKEKSYVPHLTIGRAKGPVKIKNLERFKNMEFTTVSVREIKIKKSTLTPKGPIYENISTIQL